MTTPPNNSSLPTATPQGDEAMRHFFEQRDAAQQLIGNSAMASELDALGEYLLESAEAMQSVATMSEPAREDAIAIARDILKKLKISFGGCNILEGLGLKNAEDGVLFGSIKDVVQLMEHMIAWAAGVDASILSDPSVLAAISAIGKLGYLAKRESLRIAKQANLAVLANRLMQQLAHLDVKFANAMHDKVGDLLDHIERGINRVVNRITSVGVSGGAIDHAQDHQGRSINQPPTAGLGQTGGQDRDATGKRNLESLLAEEAAHQAEAQRIAAQTARKQRSDRSNAPRLPTAGLNGRQAVQQARAAQRRAQQQTTQQVLSHMHDGEHPMTPQVNMRAVMGLHGHEDEVHHEIDIVRQQQLLHARQAQAKAPQQRGPQNTSPATTGTTQQRHGHGGHHHSGEHPLDAPVPEMQALAPEMHAHAPKAPAMGELLKGVNLKGFDMSEIKGAAVATNQAEYRAQLSAADKDQLPLPPINNPAQNKGLVR